MSAEKPLHVRVAEAIGWDMSPDHHERDEAPEGYSQCVRCGSTQYWSDEMPGICVPRYDIDWSATGPLMERFRISVWCDSGQWQAGDLDSASFEGYWLNNEENGDTVLLAVCNYIVASAAAGKLSAS